MTESVGFAILGIDPGEKRIGVAIAHSGLPVASGLGVIAYKSNYDLIRRLKAMVAEEAIGLVVMGLPVNMNGTEGDAAKLARRLAEIIKKGLGVRVVFEDERLTTDQALRQLRETGKKRGKDKGTIDIMAAVNILQTYLDAQH